MEYNYLVSVFVGGKCVNLYYSENLDDLVTIKALYKDCEIFIFDIKTYETFSKALVDAEIQRSRLRWKKSLERPNIDIFNNKSVAKKPKKLKPKKYWERPVMCVETLQVFRSIRECSEHTGIPYMTITNCIKNGNATRGVHFVNAQVRIVDEEEL